MRWSRAVLTGLLLLTALPVQAAVISRLPLPGAAPQLPLVVCLALALAYGPLEGMVIGFAGGLLVDLAPPSDHAAGRLALAWTVAGYLAGLAAEEARRSTLAPILLVGGAAVVAGGLFAGVGALLGDVRIDPHALASALPASVFYDVVLAPFVVPAVLSLAARLEPEASRR
jgi:rod shape-determining protein MreD